MAITRTQTPVTSASSTGSLTLTLGAAPTATRLVVIGLGADLPHTSITSTGNKATKAVGVNRGTTNRSSSLWYRVVQSGDTASFTFTTATATVMEGIIEEWSGLGTSPLDKTASQDGGGTNILTLTVGPSATLSRSEEVAFAHLYKNGGSGTFSAPGGSFTAEANTAKGQLLSRVVSSTAAVSATHNWTSGAQASSVLATFMAPADTPGGTVASGVARRYWIGSSWVVLAAGKRKRWNGSSWVA